MALIFGSKLVRDQRLRPRIAGSRTRLEPKETVHERSVFRQPAGKRNFPLTLLTFCDIFHLVTPSPQGGVRWKEGTRL
jgi:hypothetical protein